MAGGLDTCFVNEVLPPAVGEQHWGFFMAKPTSNYFNFINFCTCGWWWCSVVWLGWLEEQRIKDFKLAISGKNASPLWSQCEGDSAVFACSGEAGFLLLFVCQVFSWRGNKPLFSVLVSLEGSVRKQWYQMWQPLRKHNSMETNKGCASLNMSRVIDYYSYSPISFRLWWGGGRGCN